MALVNTFLGFFGQEWTGLPAYLVLAAAALWRWNAAAWQACRRNPALVGLAIIFTLILLTPFTVSQLKPIYLPGRHTAAAFPIFAVLVATWLWEVVSAPARLWAVGILWVAAASGYSVYFLRPPLEDNRPAAQYLRNQMRAGDHVVFTGISRLGVQYYWDRMEAPSSLAASVFPSEMQLHRSWIDSKALMTNESPRMQREAEAIVQKLNQEIPAGRSAWVFRGYDPGLTSLLEQGLARQGFVLRDQVPFAGSHYTHLWRYERLP
jgi:hypothetical protein